MAFKCCVTYIVLLLIENVDWIFHRVIEVSVNSFLYLTDWLIDWGFASISRKLPLPAKGYKFWPLLELIAIEQWGFFNVPHLLWQGQTVYIGHLRGPVTLTPIAERLSLELSLPVLTTWVSLDRGSNPELPHARRRPYD